MPNSPRMSWPYPPEGMDPWYDAFVGLIEAQDSAAYAVREDRGVVLMGGGLISFDATSGVLSWTSPLVLLAPITGFVWTISAGSISLQNGEKFYVDLVRAPLSNTSLSAKHAMQVPSTDQAMLIAVRVESRVYFRNGAVAIDGMPGTIIEDGGPAGTVLTPGFDKYNGDGSTTTFTLSHVVSPLRYDGVLAHRNGVLLDKIVSPATVDEYTVEEVGLTTVVRLGAPPAATDRIFVTYWY